MTSRAHLVPVRTAAPDERAPLEQRSDEELLELGSAGVMQAFAVLVGRYQVAVRSFCTRWCNSASIGDELSQEVFLDLWRARARYQPRGRFAAFLFTLARNRCRSERRRRVDEQALPDDIAPSSSTELDAILAAERQRRIDERIALLPPKLREAVMLRFTAELDYEEIARIVGRGEATVRSRVFLGLAQLRQWAEEAGL